MEKTVTEAAGLRQVALEYITPNSIRKVVRRPRVEIEAEEVRVPFNGGTLSTRRWGTGRPVLLIHGWAANQTDMFAFVPEIVSRGLQAVAMDLPAHGESSGEVTGLEELGHAVTAVGKHLGQLQGAIAHSVGGAAVQLALTNGMEADKVVILASPQDYGAGLRAFAKRKGLSDEEIDQLQAMLLEMNIKTQIRSADFVPEISVPALIVHSNDDHIIDVATAVDLARYWKNSRLLLVDELKHRGVLKDPIVIREAIDYLTQ
ncbi:MAG: alpha/beta fold hydrolase [Cyanobacteria bacterium SZAS LIN-2]|nr:alpha/beta fold hydrolase [Cyanobacteria bacterium SZAS LIN-2]